MPSRLPHLLDILASAARESTDNHAADGRIYQALWWQEIADAAERESRAASGLPARAVAA
jgi:hypothetical protein